MDFEMEKVYNPQAIEDKLYQMWEESGAFVAHRVEGKKPFTIVMPPPNITGKLHMGHAMDCLLQDAPIRYHRMKGEPHPLAARHGPRLHRHRGQGGGADGQGGPDQGDAGPRRLP